MALETIHDLFVRELRDLHSAEQQILEALPKMAKAAHSDRLAQAFDDHRLQTEVHRDRLDQVFRMVDAASNGEPCNGMAGLLAEGGKLLSERPSSDVLDAALIGAAQRVEHYEMAGYGCARTYARLLGLDDAVRLLQQTLDEEGQADHALTQLAETQINARVPERL